MVHKNYLLK